MHNHKQLQHTLLAVALLGSTALAACDDDGATDLVAGELAYDGFPYRANFAELPDGVQMHYLDEGTGTPILLLHGVPTQAYLWRNMIPTLAEHGRVIAPDMINFGKSDKIEPLTPGQHAERLTQFIEALGLEDIILVGHDWGGPFGLIYASNHPDNIRGLAFFETPVLPFPSFAVVSDEFAAAVLDPVTGPTSVIDDNFFIECFLLDPMCGGASVRDWTDAEREVYRAAFATPESREQLVFLPKYLPFLDTTGHPVYDPDGPGGEPASPSPEIALFEDYAAYLMQTQTPKLYVSGVPGLIPNGDQFGAQLQTMFPNLDTATVGSEAEPALHFIQEDRPDQLATTLGAWIDSL